MGISSVGASSFAYTPSVSGGPSAAQQAQQAEQVQQLLRNPNEEQGETPSVQASEGSGNGGGNTTPTRGQNLNITV